MTPGFFLGLVVAFGGALLLATGSELQSRAVYGANGRWRTFLRRPRWLFGLALLGLAVSTNFIALALAPVSAVQAMSVVALAASAAFGAGTGRVLMTRPGTWSVALCIIGVLGCIAVLASHPPTGSHALAPDEQLALTTLILAGTTLLGVCALGVGRLAPGVGTRLLALIAGATIFGSITTVFKAIVTLVLDHGLLATLAASGTVLGLGCVAVGGIMANVLLQRSHQHFPTPVVVAALTIVDPLTAAVIGITVLDEATLTAPASAVLIGCGVLACLGVAGVSRLRRSTAPPESPRLATGPHPAHR